MIFTGCFMSILDIAGMQIEEALGFLGELDGRQASMEIVNDIFAHFCVGK